MTNRQAIQTLKRLETPYNKDAIQMAIDALNSVPTMVKVNSELFERLRELEKAK